MYKLKGLELWIWASEGLWEVSGYQINLIKDENGDMVADSFNI